MRVTTGRYWSCHRLAAHEDVVRTFRTHATTTLAGCMEGTPFILGGIVVGLAERVIRQGRNEGKRMARFRIEDFDGAVDAVIFSEAFQRHHTLLEENRVLFFSGDLDASRDEVSVRVNTVLTPEEAPHALTGSVHLVEMDEEGGQVGACHELDGAGRRLVVVLSALVHVGCGHV